MSENGIDWEEELSDTSEWCELSVALQCGGSQAEEGVSGPTPAIRASLPRDVVPSGGSGHGTHDSSSAR